MRGIALDGIPVTEAPTEGGAQGDLSDRPYCTQCGDVAVAGLGLCVGCLKARLQAPPMPWWPPVGNQPTPPVYVPQHVVPYDNSYHDGHTLTVTTASDVTVGNVYHITGGGANGSLQVTSVGEGTLTFSTAGQPPQAPPKNITIQNNSIIASSALESFSKTIAASVASAVDKMATTAMTCSVFRPTDSYLDTCKCGQSRTSHSRDQIDAWMASVSMVLPNKHALGVW